jgi:ParB/RepB/Spo0J family partition protein
MKEQTAGYADLKLDKVFPSEMNYRKKMDKTGLKELTESVRQKGVLQPIIVRPIKGNGHYEIIAGHRRYQAATAAGLTTIPAIIEEFDDEAALEVAMTENSQREDVNPMDEAMGFKRMMDTGMEAESIAAKIGRPVAYVLGRIKLLDLCKEARQAVSEGKISLGHAQVLLRLRSKNDQKSLLTAILDGDGMTVSGAKSIIRRHSLNLKDAPFDTGNCISCAYRSGNQSVLFPELTDTDECSDPACFQKKALAFYEAHAKEKEKQGFRVIRSYEEIKELGGFNGKIRRIVPCKAEADYQSVYPSKYKSDCAKCTDHHAYYFYEQSNYSGEHIETGEICLNPKCLARMFKQQEELTKEMEMPGGSKQSGISTSVSPVTLRLHAEECRNRFLIENFPDKVAASSALSKRFIIFHMLYRFGYFSGNAKQTRDEILKEICPAEYFAERKFSGWEIYLVVMGVPKEKLDKLLKAVVRATIQYTDPKVLLHMTPEAGLDMGTDFVMDKTFLNTKKKSELVETVKALELPVNFTGKEKKSEMVDAILALDLTGKRTAEIAESCAFTELKDIKDPGEWRHNYEAAAEAGEESED